MSALAYNFSAGPAMLPREVMQRAARELLNWNGIGASVMEISHRSKAFVAIAEKTEHDLRELMNIPSNYKVIFMPGGAQAQFSFIPMNILGKYKKAAYVRTGVWSNLAFKAAERYGEMVTVTNNEANHCTTIAPQSEWQHVNDAAYLYYCDNETVNGVEFGYVPQSNLPLVCDMSSNILSRPVDVSQFGIIFACSQKNLGASGITLVIVRDDLLDNPVMPALPDMFNYSKQHAKHSMYNTPATFPWYTLHLVLEWIRDQGGVAAMAALATQRSTKLYDYIDSNPAYVNNIDPDYRSRMNVVFTLKDETQTAAFLAGADKAGLIGLKGHRLVGGVRASIYNAMPEAGVDALIAYMDSFTTR